jgi:hypothetical protein
MGHVRVPEETGSSTSILGRAVLDRHARETASPLRVLRVGPQAHRPRGAACSDAVLSPRAASATFRRSPALPTDGGITTTPDLHLRAGWWCTVHTRAASALSWRVGIAAHERLAPPGGLQALVVQPIHVGVLRCVTSSAGLAHCLAPRAPATVHCAPRRTRLRRARLVGTRGVGLRGATRRATRLRGAAGVAHCRARGSPSRRAGGSPSCRARGSAGGSTSRGAGGG